MPRASVSCLASPAISTITFNDLATQNNQMSHKCASTLVDSESKYGRKEGNKFVKWQETSNSQSASQIIQTLNTSSSMSVSNTAKARSVQPDFNKQLDEYKKKHVTLVHDTQLSFDNQLQEYRQKHKGSESHKKQGIPNRKPTAQSRQNKGRYPRNNRTQSNGLKSCKVNQHFTPSEGPRPSNPATIAKTYGSPFYKRHPIKPPIHLTKHRHQFWDQSTNRPRIPRMQDQCFNQKQEPLVSPQCHNSPWFRYHIQRESPDWIKFLNLVRQITSQ